MLNLFYMGLNRFLLMPVCMFEHPLPFSAAARPLGDT